MDEAVEQARVGVAEVEPLGAERGGRGQQGARVGRVLLGVAGEAGPLREPADEALDVLGQLRVGLRVGAVELPHGLVLVAGVLLAAHAGKFRIRIVNKRYLSTA